MTCLSELTCAVYADGELSPEETRDAERHLAECSRCRALVAALRGENRILAAALTELARSPDALRDRTVLRFTPADVTELVFHPGSGGPPSRSGAGRGRARAPPRTGRWCGRVQDPPSA